MSSIIKDENKGKRKVNRAHSIVTQRLINANNPLVISPSKDKLNKLKEAKNSLNSSIKTKDYSNIKEDKLTISPFNKNKIPNNSNKSIYKNNNNNACTISPVIRKPKKNNIFEGESVNNSIISEAAKLKAQYNIKVISGKISQLKMYQKSLKDKILETEIEKNKLLKNKNEEISYIQKNVNEKMKILKNLKKLNDKNQMIIEKSEITINNLKNELKNKNTEIKNIQNMNMHVLPPIQNYNLSQLHRNYNPSTLIIQSDIFASTNKPLKNVDCCGNSMVSNSHRPGNTEYTDYNSRIFNSTCKSQSKKVLHLSFNNNADNENLETNLGVGLF